MRSLKVGIIVAIAHAPAWAQEASFRGVGQLAGFARGNRAVGISADGATVVGTALSDQWGGWEYSNRPVVWRQGGAQILEVPNSWPYANATGMSNDARIILATGPNQFALRWIDDQYQEIPRFDSVREPTSASHGGEVYCFWGKPYVIRDNQFRLAPWGFVVHNASDDGQVVFGSLADAPAAWYRNDSVLLAPRGMVNGGGLFGSGDGLTMINQCLVWRIGTSEVRQLCTAEGWMVAVACSYDASILVGYSWHNGVIDASVCEDVPGGRSIACLLRRLGVASVDGWLLSEAVGVSSDGRTIVGNGLNPQGKAEAWIARLPELPPTPDIDRDGAIDDQDFFAFINDFVAGNTSADFNLDQSIDDFDYFEFLTAFFCGC